MPNLTASARGTVAPVGGLPLRSSRVAGYSLLWLGRVSALREDTAPASVFVEDKRANLPQQWSDRVEIGLGDWLGCGLPCAFVTEIVKAAAP